MRASDLCSLGFPHHSCICRREPGAPFPGLGSPAVPPSSYVYSAHFHRHKHRASSLTAFSHLIFRHCAAKHVHSSIHGFYVFTRTLQRDRQRAQTETHLSWLNSTQALHPALTPTACLLTHPSQRSSKPRRFATILLPPCP